LKYWGGLLIEHGETQQQLRDSWVSLRSTQPTVAEMMIKAEKHRTDGPEGDGSSHGSCIAQVV
jgi:hypothetical protein